MEVKEHIKSLKELTICKGLTLVISQETIDTINEVISLLQQGDKDSKELKITKEELKKYRQMWEEFKGKYGNYFTVFDIEKIFISGMMEDIKQKYFPKAK